MLEFFFFFFKGLTLGYLKKQKKKRKTHVKKIKNKKTLRLRKSERETLIKTQTLFSLKN